MLLAVVYGMFFAIEKNRDSGLGVALLLGLTLFLGIILGPLLQVAIGMRNGGQLIATRRRRHGDRVLRDGRYCNDHQARLRLHGNFLAVGGIVLMLAVVANMFFASPVLYLTICAAFVLFSSMMILWQVNQIVQRRRDQLRLRDAHALHEHLQPVHQPAAVLMALTGQRD